MGRGGAGTFFMHVLKGGAIKNYASVLPATVGRSVDDFHPRVQLRVIFREDNSFFDNPDNITDFSQKYVVTEDAIKMYVNHMKLLSLRKEIR